MLPFPYKRTGKPLFKRRGLERLKDLGFSKTTGAQLKLFLLGVFFLAVYFVLNSPSSPPSSYRHLEEEEKTPSLSEVEEYTFAQEPVKVDARLTKNKEQESFNPPVRIIIPSLSVDLEVETAPIVKGYWKVFPDKAGFGQGSAFPGQKGNQVIFAHAREGLFLPLKEIKEEDEIYVLTDNGWFFYEVREIKTVLPEQIEVIAPTDDETLTLFTCSGFADTKRLIIVAKRV